jgi:hypothetical protein
VYRRNGATMPNGLSSTEIRVRGSDPNDPVCTIPVTVRAPGMFELVPSTLRFEQDDAPQLRLLFIRQHGKHPVSVLDVRSPGDKIKCEIYAEPSRPDYRVYVRAQDLGQARGFVGDVVVTTDRAPTDEVGAATAPWTIRVPVVVGLAADETAPEQ